MVPVQTVTTTEPRPTEVWEEAATELEAELSTREEERERVQAQEERPPIRSQQVPM